MDAHEPDGGRRAEPRATVLVVDDDASIRFVFSAALEQAGYATLVADSTETALDLLKRHVVDLALVDLEMPGGSGLELADAIRSDPQLESMGIVVVTGDGALDSKLAGLGAGADDYLVKPVELEELLARVGAQVRQRSSWLSRLEHQLQVRSGMARRIADLDPSMPLALLERHLHTILHTELDLVDLSIDPPSPLEASGDGGLSIAPERTGTRVRVPLRFAGSVVGILVVVVGSHMEQAVSALSDLAPQLGAVVADGMARHDSTEEVRQWVAALRPSDGISAVYQPIVSLHDGTLAGYEGLSRFADGTAPDVAFARASAAGAGPDLEILAIERLLAGAHALVPGAWLSLNVSATTMLTGDFIALLAAATTPLVVELTEHEHVDDYAGVRKRLAHLPGVQLAVDDAGAGYASLRHIFELRPDLIKLDREWIAHIDGDPVRRALVHGLMGFAGAFGAVIVAEGVEREEEADVLRTLGVPLAQGYLFGHPAPALTAWPLG